ncbi:MAG: ATP-binding protein [Planctomycetes bacterium]|nr:ATP-binding protein [Planctomycetota bacterium]MCC7066577.1 ATP-binding protein [Planctomycetota bacterium]
MRDELAIQIRGDLAELAQVNAKVTDLLQRHGTGAEVVYRAQLALEEVLSNVIRHGYEDNPAEHAITIHVQLLPDGVRLEFVDDGRAFDPLSVAEVDLDLPLEDRRVGGLGVHLLRTMTKGLNYERKAGCNHLRVDL